MPSKGEVDVRRKPDPRAVVAGASRRPEAEEPGEPERQLREGGRWYPAEAS
jgi:hypothetical protein